MYALVVKESKRDTQVVHRRTIHDVLPREAPVQLLNPCSWQNEGERTIGRSSVMI